MAADRQKPPCSLTYGGRSVPPPPSVILSGDLVIIMGLQIPNSHANRNRNSDLWRPAQCSQPRAVEQNVWRITDPTALTTRIDSLRLHAELFADDVQRLIHSDSS